MGDPCPFTQVAALAGYATLAAAVLGLILGVVLGAALVALLLKPNA